MTPQYLPEDPVSQKSRREKAAVLKALKDERDRTSTGTDKAHNPGCAGFGALDIHDVDCSQP